MDRTFFLIGAASLAALPLIGKAVVNWLRR